MPALFNNNVRVKQCCPKFDQIHFRLPLDVVECVQAQIMLDPVYIYRQTSD